MLVVDGSYGEGGGQILRLSVALSALTKTPIRVKNIRVKRRTPGLRPQHIAAINSVKELTNAEVEGLDLGSSEVIFRPGRIGGGELRFDVGTAGSVTLVLQACCLPAMFAEEKVRLRIKGGTDVPYSPPWDYFANVFIPLLSKMGARVSAGVERRGYFPKGGGEVRVEIEPVETLKPLRIVQAREFQFEGKINISDSLPFDIAERIGKSASQTVLRSKMKTPEIEMESGKSFSPGCGVVLWAKSNEAILGSSALGEKRLPAKRVGYLAGKDLLEEIDAGATVDVHAFDQLLPYMALAAREGASEVLIRDWTAHAKAIQWLIKKFMGVDFLTKKVNSRLEVVIK